MSAATTSNYDIEEMNWDARTYYGVKTNTTFDKIAAFFGQSYGKIGLAMKKPK